jgi:hypothetical protein
MVYVVSEETVSAIPPMRPVDALTDKPRGKDGLMAYPVTAPPLLVGEGKVPV